MNPVTKRQDGVIAGAAEKILFMVREPQHERRIANDFITSSVRPGLSLSEDVGIGKIVGVFEVFVAEVEDVTAGFVVVD